MTCVRCGHELPSPTPSFCPNCGAATAPPEVPRPEPGSGGFAGGGYGGAPIPPLGGAAGEPAGPGGGGGRTGLPWENRSSLLDLGAMLSTIGKVLFDAPAAYRAMRTEGGLGGPLFFSIVLGTLCGWVGMVWQLLFRSFTEGMMPAGGESPFGKLDGMALLNNPAFQAAQAVMLPAILLLLIFIIAGIYHVFLMMFGGAKRSFETTVRVVCFANGSSSVFQLIPFCGGIIALIWGLVIEIIGLAEAHETSMGKSAAAVLVPIVACCLCIIVAISLALGLTLSGLSRA